MPTSRRRSRRSIRGHIFGFLTKPVARDTLAATFDGALRQHAVATAEKDVLERTLAGAIRILVEILAATMPEVFGRTARIRDLCRALAATIEVNRWRLDMAALLGAIGWTTLPARVVEKWRQGGNLGVEEADLVAGVPEIGARLVANIPRLGPIAEIIRQQACRFDGADAAAGQPAGGAIAIEARLLRWSTTWSKRLAMPGRRWRISIACSATPAPMIRHSSMSSGRGCGRTRRRP